MVSVRASLESQVLGRIVLDKRAAPVKCRKKEDVPLHFPFGASTIVILKGFGVIDRRFSTRSSDD